MIVNKKRLLPLLVLMTLSFFYACEDTIESVAPIVHDDNFVQYNTPFDGVPDAADVIMYEVNLFAFDQSRSFQAVEHRLDSIQALGVNVIWLMPIYPIGKVESVGSPYSISDFVTTNEEFGTLDDLRSLVDEAHSRDIAVILDWVANHTSWDHPWTVSHKEWYEQNDSGNIVAPPYFPDVVALNFDNEEMRREMILAMKYWVLEANIDGFRCDHADGVPAEFWSEANYNLRSIPNRKVLTFAESADKSLAFSGFDMLFGWGFYNKLNDVYDAKIDASSLVTPNNSEYTNIPNSTRFVRFTTNHDDNIWDNIPQVIFGTQQGAMSAFVISTMMGGSPLIYNGQEVGCDIQLSFFEDGNTYIDWSANPKIFQEYKKIVNFRKNSEVIKRGEIEVYRHPDILTFKRMLNNEEVLVMVNVRSSGKNYAPPVELLNTTYTNVLTQEKMTLKSPLYLEPYQYFILQK
ncbi:MAG: alpha-amylase family glycosyl hydrolase [Bacteroidales bacterium]|jgi:alpha-amylase|nr:alpha-amylase family glycosyl hydrolase [Bacteroidales bacterium]